MMNAKEFLERGGTKATLEQMLNHVFITKSETTNFKKALIETKILKPNSKSNIRTQIFKGRQHLDGIFVDGQKIYFVDGRGSNMHSMILTIEDYKLLDEVSNG